MYADFIVFQHTAGYTMVRVMQQQNPESFQQFVFFKEKCLENKKCTKDWDIEHNKWAKYYFIVSLSHSLITK